MSRRATEFQTIRSEGGLLPPGLLRRIVDPAGKVAGVEPTAYGLPAGERLNEAITQSWNRLRRHWAEFRAARKASGAQAANRESRIAHGPERAVNDGKREPQSVPRLSPLVPRPSSPHSPLATRHSPLAESEALTGLTNDKWSLPLLRELGFGFLATTAGPTIDGKTYAISRFAGNTAIHLVGCGVDLDRRAAGVRGAAAGNPHGLVQEFLNRSPGHLWAIVSNGLSFRILRDNQALSRQSFLEFDLEAMFDGEVYSDFVLLWLIAHASRFLPRTDGRPDSCWLEAWSKEAAEQGVAALTDLRGGVEKALEILGQGFVSHPKNTALRDALRKGEVKLSDFHHQLLRVVYRLIFLFVAEDRELEGIPILHIREDKANGAEPATTTPFAARYSLFARFYSTSRLRELASRIKGSRHGDLWRQFQLLVGALSGDARFAAMRNALALPPLGSMLWNPASTSLLNGPGLASGEEQGASGESSETSPPPSPAAGAPHSPLATHHSPLRTPPSPAAGAELSNHDFLEALRHLAFIRKDKILRPVDYKNLGSEEFGGVYESFLALTPQISSDGARFTFAEFAGNERKTSGSYYTPDSLVQCLLDSALDPVVGERLELAAQVARSEWRVVSEEARNNPQIRKYVDSILPRLGGVAARHDAGGTGLPPNQSLPEGGTVRNDLPNSSGSSLDSGERGRGLGQGGDGGISTVPANSSREPSRTGNTPNAGSAGGSLFTGSGQTAIGNRHDPQQATPQPPTEPSGAISEERVAIDRKATSPLTTHQSPIADAQRLWNSTPLATRHSLLAETALLSLKVCDMACGSGHFLVGAAHRLARHLARVRALAAGESEPSPLLYQTALRDVIGHCLYGVDINPMAVELCKVTLWLEALEPGKPLSFLDHHIRCGNSLLGATPELIAAGLPDEAFDPIEGDDKAACSILKKLNRAQREGLRHLFIAEDNAIRHRLRQTAAAIEEMGDSRPEEIQRKEAAFRAEQSNYDFQKAWDLANLWCAAFVVKKRVASGEWQVGKTGTANGLVENPVPAIVQTEMFGDGPTRSSPLNPRRPRLAPRPSPLATPYGITTQHLRDFVESGALPEGLLPEARRLADQYQFFHWHLAFPEVFAQDGFDVNLGNPPWDTLSPDQREFFGKWVSGLRSMSPEEQQKQIDHLLADPGILAQWTAHCRDLFALVHFLKQSGAFTLYAPGNLGKGDFNIYRMFTEAALRHIRNGGFASLVVPGGLYGGANASAIRQHLLDKCQLSTLFGLINTKRGWFKEVDIDRFSAFAAMRGGRTEAFRAFFGLSAPEDLGKVPVEVRADIIRQLSPETYAIPDVRDLSQLTTSQKMYAAGPAFGNTSLGLPIRHYSRELDMGNDRDLFTTDPAGLPVYEGRMIDHFDHRAKTYESGHGNSAVWIERSFGDTAKAIVPQWRVLRQSIPSKLGDRCDHYRIGFGDVANPRNERSFVATLIPPGVICGHKVPTIVFGSDHGWAYLPWLAVASSLAMDWLARRRLNAPTMSYTLLDSMPFPRPAISDEFVQTVAPVVLRLTCTATEMTPFWNKMAKLGLVDAVPENTVPAAALTDPESRALARADLDAFVAVKVFALTRQEISEQMDTFDVLRRREEKAYKEFRTKRLILEAFGRIP